MKRTKIERDLSAFPAQFYEILKDAPLYDSSCSPEARVWFIDRDEGFFLKRAPKGKLSREAAMTRYFHSKDLAAQVLAYESLDDDWMLTSRVKGEDCTHPMYTEDPKRLCDLLATRLRSLHELPFDGCPVDRTATFLETAHSNYRAGKWDESLFPDNWGYSSAQQAWEVVQANGKYLQRDVLLHGDYCFPNVILDNWNFSGFIDLDTAGIGDRHIDLFWGQWSLFFNLKTDQYGQRFLDAYGRDQVNEEMLRTVAAFEVFG